MPMDSINAAGDWFLATVPRLSLEVGLLILVLLALDMGLRRRVSATLRHALWLLLLVRLVVPVSVASPTSPAWWLQDTDDRVLPALGAPLPDPAPRIPVVADRGPQPSSPKAVGPAGAVAPQSAAEATPTLGGILVLSWGGILGGWCLVLLWRHRKVRRLLAGGTPATGAVAALFNGLCRELKVGRRVSLRLMPGNHTPFVVGLLRPVVAVPVSLATELDESALRAVLRHELCHLRRGDLAVNGLQVILQAVHFFNPLVWLANRRIRLVREEAVDEMVLVHAGEEAEMYPQTLIDVARRLVRHPLRDAALLGVVERRTTLRRRIEHMLARPRPQRCRLGWGGYALLLVLGVVLLPMGAAQVGLRPAPKKQPVTEGKETPAPGQEAKTPPKAKKAPTLNWRGERRRMIFAKIWMQHGLDWLIRRQRADGSWPSPSMNQVGVTGLATLALMAGGSTLREGPYNRQVKAAIKWLKDNQQEDGLIGRKAGQSFFYNHLIASLAMCRAMGVSDYRILKSPVQKAINWVCQARNPYKAWRYYPRDGDNDTSVTSWAVRLLCEAKRYPRMGLKIDENALRGAQAWLAEMTDPNTGRVGYVQRGSFPARNQKLVDRYPAVHSEALTAASLYCSLLLGQDPAKVPLLKAQAGLLAEKPPTWDPKAGKIDLYYWHYATFALRRLGGAQWLKWRRSLIMEAGKGQVRTGEEEGSWPTTCAWGAEGGPVYTTALMVLTLDQCRRDGAKTVPLDLEHQYSKQTLEEIAKVVKVLDVLSPESAAAILDAWLPQGQRRVLLVLKKLPPDKAKAIVRQMKKARGIGFAPFKSAVGGRSGRKEGPGTKAAREEMQRRIREFLRRQAAKRGAR